MLGRVSSVADIEPLRPIAEVLSFERATLRDPARRPNLVQENYFAGVPCIVYHYENSSLLGARANLK